MKPRIFKAHADLRRWFEQHHAGRSELWIAFYRKSSGRVCVGYSDALDLALCFGWIDGVRRKIDDLRYTNRFSPRRSRSIWSNVNVRRVEALVAKGLMHPAGLAAFNARQSALTGVYSFERRADLVLEPEMSRRFRARPRAWAFFKAQAPWYQRTATHWVVSAKRPETRERRFAELLEQSGQGAFIGGTVLGGRKPRPIPGKRGPG